MRVALAWLRIDLRLRWRALLTLGLLIALATGAVLSAAAGTRRGGSAVERLQARTLPSTATVLPNQPGFDWNRIRALPEVASVGEFAVSTYEIEGLPSSEAYAGYAGFPLVGDDTLTGLERPVMLAGRMYDPRRADEAVVSARFLEHYHHRLGDVVTARLATPAQLDGEFAQGGSPTPSGPRQPLRIVGVIRAPWFTDQVGAPGGIQPTPAFTQRYRANLLGTGQHIYVNALVRLRGGEADLPRFTRDLTRVTGRHDIDVWNNADLIRHAAKVTGFESDVLLALAASAAAAAAVLIGQTLSRYSAASVADLRVLQALGLTPRQTVLAAALGPSLAALAGTAAGVAGALAASALFPIGAATRYEPAPGFDADWPVLVGGAIATVLLAIAATAWAAAAALAAARRPATSSRASALARLVTRLGLPVPVQVGTRFALEPGIGRAAVPVRPALVGAVVGVLGVLAALTFRAGVVDTAGDPQRFGQTFQVGTFLGLGGQDFVAAGPALRALAADPEVVAVNDTRVGVVSLGETPVTVFSYHPVGHGIRTVVLSGRMPAGPGEIALAPESLRAAHLRIGDRVPAAGAFVAAGPGRPGGVATGTLRVTGVVFVPEDSHNDYVTGAWLTSAGFDRLFPGGTFKFHSAHVALRPGADPRAAGARLSKAASGAAGGDVEVTPVPVSAAAAEVREVRTLPLILGAFLAVLAVAAMGHALSTALRRRRHDLAVLRALGMTRPQTRAVLAVQATVLALVGLAAGVPLGLVVGRTLWRLIADRMPVLYVAPLAATALVLTGPAVLAVANLVASMFARRAARLQPAAVLRAQ
ncbi:ABC transporter permease [Frankia tisae]|uniref:ABC transporter permease n=1 Tax=Frankia tisae TaxID=2950104 RepID=UPI0021BE09CD|nr:FtsX-like permease family protein [Frankia tisae]